MAGIDNLLPDLTPSERAYFDTKGETDPAPPAPEPVPAPGPTPAELQERRALEQERAERARYDAKVDAVIASLPAATPQPAPVPEIPAEIPAFDADPLTHLAAKMTVLERQNAALIADIRTAQTVEAAKSFLTDAASQERAFTEKNPDYVEASNYLVRSRDSELQAMGIADPQQRAALIQQDAIGLALLAKQQGKNPAAVIYENAKLRGFKSASGAANAHGGNRGGSRQTRAEQVAGMSDEQFSDWYANAPASERRAVLGG